MYHFYMGYTGLSRDLMPQSPNGNIYGRFTWPCRPLWLKVVTKYSLTMLQVLNEHNE